MDIWYKYLATNVAIALIMLISGKIFSNRAPKNINTFIGYRTTMSMKNRDTWEFAHKISGKLLWKCGEHERNYYCYLKRLLSRVPN